MQSAGVAHGQHALWIALLIVGFGETVLSPGDGFARFSECDAADRLSDRPAPHGCAQRSVAAGVAGAPGLAREEGLASYSFPQQKSAYWASSLDQHPGRLRSGFAHEDPDPVIVGRL